MSKTVYRLMRAGWVCLLTILVCAPMGAAQTEPAQAQSPSEAAGPEAEHHVSPQEANELFRSVDEVLKFVSHETNLGIKRPVKRALVSREQVQKYVEARIANDEDARRLRRSELVLKKFGLLPRDFDLQSFLIGLLREQVAGYYDPKTKTVNLLDWIEPDLQRPVLAHELTHALQDQDFGLERWMKKSPPGRPRQDDNNAEAAQDEQIAARQAVIEGQAMLVLINYELAPTGQSILDAPALGEAMKSNMAAGSPIFNRAPLYLRQSLMFAYTYGLDFERTLLQQGGKEKAFAGVLQNPPLNTRQVMQPATYLANEQLEPMRVPDLRRVLGKGYEQVDVGAMGEFDVAVLLEQFAGAGAAKPLWPQWRGGYYYALRPKKDAPGSVALLYVSRWAEPEQATRFADIYASSLKQKYKMVEPVMRQIAALPQGSVQVSIGNATTQWNTEEGPVFIEPHGDTVLVMESFDEGTAAKLRDTVVPSAAVR